MNWYEKSSATIVEAKKKEEKKDNNPWAICTESVGRDNPEKYERCIMEVKKKNGQA
jgi:hypothetical protein